MTSPKKPSRKCQRMREFVNLTVVGIFHFGTSYGHLNGYRYQLVAKEIRNVGAIQKGMKDSAEEKKAEEQGACGGVSPKIEFFAQSVGRKCSKIVF